MSAPFGVDLGAPEADTRPWTTFTGSRPKARQYQNFVDTSAD